MRRSSRKSVTAAMVRGAGRLRNVSEVDAILEAAAERRARGERLALATVVSVRGSSYRRPGARLLVPEDGAPIGLISGGCLEEEAARLARRRSRSTHRCS